MGKVRTTGRAAKAARMHARAAALGTPIKWGDKGKYSPDVEIFGRE